MTSDRPYRSAKSSEEAMDELERCAGSQFDRSVVRAFLHMDPLILIPETKRETG